MKGMIFDIQEFTLHDGPGGRITIFMKGCPLRCVWCHNPEGQNIDKEIMYKKNRCSHCDLCESFQKVGNCPTQALSICGYEMTSDEIVERVLRIKESLELMQGGVTFSGGEPTFQKDFIIECLKKLKSNGIHTAIETCGYCDSKTFKEVIEYCDYVFMDLKIMNDEKHICYTGKSNKRILENARILMNSKKEYCFRTPCIENITDTKENLNDIQNFIGSAKWEKLPSNLLASNKYEQLNRKFSL